MLEYKMRSEEERMEELQNGIKNLAKYSDKEDLTTDFLQSRMQEVTYLGMDNLDEAVGQMLLEKLEEKINEITTTESISIKDLFDKREIENELLNNEARMPEGYSNEVILFAFRNNPSALIEEVGYDVENSMSADNIVEELTEMYKMGVGTMVLDITKELGIEDPDYLSLADLKEISNEINIQINGYGDYYGKDEIESDRKEFNKNQEKEKNDEYEY